MCAAGVTDTGIRGAVTPYYESARALLFCGETRDVLRHWTEPVSAVIVDPPYGDIGYLQQIADGLKAWDAVDVAVWLAHRLEAYQTWLPACKQMVGAGPLWVFQHLQYVPAFHAMATIVHWPPRRMWQLSAEEALLYCCTGRDLRETEIAQVRDAVGLNRYGTKDAEWIAQLVALSPEGPILDPFCGLGSTLVAGLRAGRRVIGIERDEAVCATVVQRLEAM